MKKRTITEPRQANRWGAYWRGMKVVTSCSFSIFCPTTKAASFGALCHFSSVRFGLHPPLRETDLGQAARTPPSSHPCGVPPPSFPLLVQRQPRSWGELILPRVTLINKEKISQNDLAWRDNSECLLCGSPEDSQQNWPPVTAENRTVRPPLQTFPPSLPHSPTF